MLLLRGYGDVVWFWCIDVTGVGQIQSGLGTSNTDLHGGHHGGLAAVNLDFGSYFPVWKYAASRYNCVLDVAQSAVLKQTKMCVGPSPHLWVAPRRALGTQTAASAVLVAMSCE